jgi:predicted secreted protein
MSWISIAAIFFIIWWTVLFATLPFGLKTQDEDEEDITPGTVSSAPRGPHMLRAFIRTTIVSVVLMGMIYVLTQVYGFGIDDLPRIIPESG